jgi:hypothetical protein
LLLHLICAYYKIERLLQNKMSYSPSIVDIIFVGVLQIFWAVLQSCAAVSPYSLSDLFSMDIHSVLSLPDIHRKTPPGLKS